MEELENNQHERKSGEKEADKKSGKEELNKWNKNKKGKYRTCGRRLSQTKASRLRRQRQKQERLEDSEGKEEYTVKGKNVSNETEESNEDKAIAYNNNHGNISNQVSDNIESVLQVDIDKRGINEKNAVEEEAEEFEEVLEEIEVLIEEEKEEVLIEEEKEIVLIEKEEELLEEIKVSMEEEEEEEEEEENREVQNETVEQKIKILVEAEEEAYMREKSVLLEDQIQLDEVEDKIEEIIVEEIIIEETLVTVEAVEEKYDEDEEEMEENISQCEMTSLKNNDEMECMIENEEEQFQEESEEEKQNECTTRHENGKGTKILKEFATDEREISMMSHVINDTIQKVAVENNHKKDCSSKMWKIVDRYRKGLKTKYKLQCHTCGAFLSIWSEPTKEDYLDINLGSALGTITAGIGYSTMEEALAAINVHYMSPAMYIKSRLNIGLKVIDINKKRMKAAAKREAEIAKAKGHLIEGIPYITTIVDCAWSKRSYRSSAYDSLGGCVVIIGYETNEIIDIIVRNIPCAVCQRAMKEEREPKEHECFSNYDESKSSSAMESDAVLEAFMTSVEKYGLIYKYRIGDGDSSTDAILANHDPYENYGVVIKKLECNNHKFRNLCQLIDEISSEKEENKDANIGNAQARQLLRNKKLKLRIEIITASDRRREDDTLMIDEKIDLLGKDIMNVLSHVYGEHKDCAKLNWPCKGMNLLNEENVMPMLRNTDAYSKILGGLSTLRRFADSLLYKVTTNAVESANNVICKMISGKRICYNMREGYVVRCHAAAMQFNTKKVLTTVHEGIEKQVPQVAEVMETRRKLKIENNKQYAQENRRTKRYLKKNMDKDYGPNSKKPDLSPELYAKEFNELMEELQKNQIERDAITKRTIMQSQSLEWKRLRSKMLTASNFGDVSKRLKTTLCAGQVKRILFNKVVTDAMQYGIDMEDTARKNLSEKLGVKIENCGFFIDPEIKFLGGSPDGLIKEELYDVDIPINKIMNRNCRAHLYESVEGGIVEIKCPYSAKDMTIEEAKQKNSAVKNIFEKKDMMFIKTSHNYYHQMQGLLHCTRRKYCIFVIWTLKDMDMTVILRDDKFWNKIEKKLSDFYLYCLVPEIIDSRFKRNCPIREPEYILEARVPYLAARQKKAKGKFNNILQKRIEAEKEDINNENTSRTNEAEGESKVLCKRKQDYEENVQKDVKRRKVRDDWTHEEVRNEGEMLAPTEEELLIFQEIVNSEASFQELKRIILDVNEKLDDACIDKFLQVLQMYFPDREFLSVHHLTNPKFIKPCKKNEDVQIVGGSRSDHWRCFYFREEVLYIFDSLFRMSFKDLTEEEKIFIMRRYPNLNTENVIPAEVTRQPDLLICGVYAGAFAMSLCLDEDPRNQDYSVDQVQMRQHFFTIIKNKEITRFPVKFEDVIEIND